jgi:hypothetical protein
MGRFETAWLAQPENLAALADLPGRWIDTVHQRRAPKMIVLDIVSHRRYVTFHMAEVAVPRQMFQKILSLIARLRAPPAPA